LQRNAPQSHKEHEDVFKKVIDLLVIFVALWCDRWMFAFGAVSREYRGSVLPLN
jgi:hypothetical protein